MVGSLGSHQRHHHHQGGNSSELGFQHLWQDSETSVIEEELDEIASRAAKQQDGGSGGFAWMARNWRAAVALTGVTLGLTALIAHHPIITRSKMYLHMINPGWYAKQRIPQGEILSNSLKEQLKEGLRRAGDHRCLLVMGPRQSGKSTCAIQLCSEEPMAVYCSFRELQHQQFASQHLSHYFGFGNWIASITSRYLYKTEQDRVFRALLELEALLRWIKFPELQPLSFKLVVRLRNKGRFPKPRTDQRPLLVFDEVQNLHTADYEIPLMDTQPNSNQQKEQKFEVFLALLNKTVALTQDSHLARIMFLSSSVYLKELLHTTPLHENDRRVDIDVFGFSKDEAVTYLAQHGCSRAVSTIITEQIGQKVGILQEFLMYSSAADLVSETRARDILNQFVEMRTSKYHRWLKRHIDELTEVQKVDEYDLREFFEKVYAGTASDIDLPDKMTLRSRVFAGDRKVLYVDSLGKVIPIDGLSRKALHAALFGNQELIGSRHAQPTATSV